MTSHNQAYVLIIRERKDLGSAYVYPASSFLDALAELSYQARTSWGLITIPQGATLSVLQKIFHEKHPDGEITILPVSPRRLPEEKGATHEGQIKSGYLESGDRAGWFHYDGDELTVYLQGPDVTRSYKIGGTPRPVITDFVLGGVYPDLLDYTESAHATR